MFQRQRWYIRWKFLGTYLSLRIEHGRQSIKDDNANIWWEELYEAFYLPSLIELEVREIPLLRLTEDK